MLKGKKLHAKPEKADQVPSSKVDPESGPTALAGSLSVAKSSLARAWPDESRPASAALPTEISPGPRKAPADAARKLGLHTTFLATSLPFDHRTRIVDVGANPANRPAYADLAEAGFADVHGFEPGEEAYRRLIETRGAHETYHPYAVGVGGPATFYATRNGSFASIFQPDPDQITTLGQWEKSLTVMEEIPMTTVSLDSIASLPRPDMLKMDTQGAELQILEGGSNCLSDAVVIMPELRFFQLYRNEPMMGRVDIKLREMGFMLHKVLPGAQVRIVSNHIDRLRPSMTRNQMIDADAIYVRDLACHKTMSNAQLSHLALLADAVFQSMDVVLRCLDLLVQRHAISEAQIDAYIARLPRNYVATP